MDENLKSAIARAAAVLKEMGATEVYLFGSAAEGDLRDGSDIDLAVSGLPDQVFFKALAKASELLPCELDLISLDDDTSFTRYLRKQGELRRVA